MLGVPVIAIIVYWDPFWSPYLWKPSNDMPEVTSGNAEREAFEGKKQSCQAGVLGSSHALPLKDQAALEDVG